MKGIIGGVAAALIGIAAFAVPQQAVAGVVGEYLACQFGVNPATAAIEAAGHTRVAVTTLDAGSLAPLDALLVRSCGPTGYASNVAVNNAVASGMGLVVDHYEWSLSLTFTEGAALPGLPALDYTSTMRCTRKNEVVQSSPIAAGPGGLLAPSALDPDGLCTLMHTVRESSLPAGSIPFIRALHYNLAPTDQVGAFGYPFGSGRVVYGETQFINLMTSPAVITYFANALHWVTEQAVSTTCASEGYTGTKLVWCQNICEKGYTGATLQTWIHRWIRQFRDLPYCAMEPSVPADT